MGKPHITGIGDTARREIEEILKRDPTYAYAAFMDRKACEGAEALKGE